jgi:hypothetical protein
MGAENSYRAEAGLPPIENISQTKIAKVGVDAN